MIAAPCKDCPDRCANPNCHAKCERYNDFLRKHKAESKALRAEHERLVEIGGQLLTFDPRFERRKGKKRGR